MAELLIDSEDYLDLLKDFAEAAIEGLTARPGDLDPEAIADMAVRIATQTAHGVLAAVAEQEDAFEDDEDDEDEEEDEEGEDGSSEKQEPAEEPVD